MKMQQELKELGYTDEYELAVLEFQLDHGLVVDGDVGPKTTALINKILAEKPANRKSYQTPPWVKEMLKVHGMHERRQFKELYAWLKSAGKAVNPADTPWCGDAVETSLLRALPHASVPANPHASISWLTFGQSLREPMFGCILIFWRGNPKGWQGHVGYYVGEDATHYHVLGGNQSDSVSIARIAKNRLREYGMRWPIGYPFTTRGRAVAGGGSLKTTTNEE